MTTIDLDAFTRSYMQTALWLSHDTDTVGDMLDERYTVDDFHPDAVARMQRDCERFVRDNVDDLVAWPGGRSTAAEMGGHDFWLTRNGHGAGFWDGDWPDQVGERLTAAAKAFGEQDIQIGDDGYLYTFGGRDEAE